MVNDKKHWAICQQIKLLQSNHSIKPHLTINISLLETSSTGNRQPVFNSKLLIFSVINSATNTRVNVEMHTCFFEETIFTV